jgi:hypothetical protein
MRHLTLFALILTFILPLSSLAQDRGVFYQAIARDNNGDLLANANIDVRFRILQGGSTIYEEVQAVSTNDYGLFSAVIGSTDFASFNTLDWNTDLTSLNVAVDEGSGFVNMGTTTFESVPYSKVATDMTTTDLQDVSGTPNMGEVLKWNGTSWAPATDDAGSGSLWTQSGSDISYTTGDVGIGVANPSHPLHIVHSTTTQNTISIEAGNPPANRDVLEIKVDAGTDDGAQFIEFERGASVVARINTDGSAEFPQIEYADGTVQTAGGPLAKGNLDITNTSTGTVTVIGSNDLTATYNTTSDYIEVTMAGLSLDPTLHMVHVTPIRVNSSSATLDRSASVFFSGGKVRVYVWDASAGAAVPNDCFISIYEL